jgi:hypothetical protein
MFIARRGKFHRASFAEIRYFLFGCKFTRQITAYLRSDRFLGIIHFFSKD